MNEYELRMITSGRSTAQVRKWVGGTYWLQVEAKGSTICIHKKVIRVKKKRWAFSIHIFYTKFNVDMEHGQIFMMYVILPHKRYRIEAAVGRISPIDTVSHLSFLIKGNLLLQ